VVVAVLAVVAVVAVALGGLAIALLGPDGAGPGRSPGGTTAAVATPTASGSTAPSATRPPTDPSPSIDSSSPRPTGIVAVRIEVPRLGIDLRIVEGDGMDAPIGVAAHFPGTAWPDAGSNTYLYGHAQEGMFLPLWEVRTADEILLTLANQQQRCFAVDEIIPEAPWNETSLLMPTDHERLTLQTSTSYTPTAPRFVVIALPCG
jgi:LPXTG-site transpeptidase (sortase) family protein